jgi:hypothetical protein
MPYVTRWERRGHEQGLADGRLQANRESALTLLKAKVDPEIVFAATGLRPEDLNTSDIAKPDPLSGRHINPEASQIRAALGQRLLSLNQEPLFAIG